MAETLTAPSPILVLGDPRLRMPAEAVGGSYPALAEDIACVLRALAAARAQHGFGRALAAPQIGIARRIIAVDLGAGPFVILDPEIVWRSPETFLVWDDCFSLPEQLVRVRRHVSISLRFRDGALTDRRWEELPSDLAELMQHEIDHLDGVLMVDRAEGEDAVQPMSRRAELIDMARPARRLSLADVA